jgi:hypothetical protein
MSELTKTVSLLCVVAAIMGCGAVDEVENTLTCRQVCDRYKECFDSDYDVDECADSCEEEASADEDEDRRLERCDSCIDDRSCSEAVFNCATDCAGVIN